MPDHNAATIRGRAGRLLWGSRVVTEFERWTARPTGSSFEVAVERHEPDPVWWEYAATHPLTAELDIGRDGIRGRTRDLSRTPLHFILEESHAG